MLLDLIKNRYALRSFDKDKQPSFEAEIILHICHGLTISSPIAERTRRLQCRCEPYKKASRFCL